MENKITLEDATQFIEKMYPMAVFDKEGRYTYVNPSWMNHIRTQIGEEIKTEDILGKKVTDIIPDSKVYSVLKYGVPITGEYIPSSGTFVSYIPRFSKDGAVNGCYIYVIIPEMDVAKSLSKKIDSLSNELEFYKSELSKTRGARYNLDNIIGKSDAVVKLKKEIMKAANTASTVLIEGETGTGKELIAHAIHAKSQRYAQNFVPVNCSAVPMELMESEFFGYASGAFTGASKKGKIGKFQLADKGTLFLDEVNLLPMAMQPKFLRVLQEREIDPVGGDESIPIDIRLIAASNISLEKLVESRDFRQDLYFRVNVIKISVPPLRDRIEDIPLLVEHLIKRLNEQLGMFIKGIDPEVLNIFETYDWPGNIRELQNVLEGAMNAASSPILEMENFERFLERINGRAYIYKAAHNKLRESKADLERDMLLSAIEKNGGNKAKASRDLGISRSVLYRKLKKFNIPV